ncbi:MAG: tetratricopeptide repeat protein [Sulfuricella sp.]
MPTPMSKRLNQSTDCSGANGASANNLSDNITEFMNDSNHALALQSALEHHQAGRLAQAEEIYRQILQVDPDHPDALHLLGMLAHQIGQNEIAAKLINRAIQANPQHPFFHSTLGAVYQALNRLEDAVVSYRTAITLKPDYAEAHNNLGSTLKNQGKLDEAITNCQQALIFNPDFAEAHYNLGAIFGARENLGEAIACYRQAIALKPDFADAHYNLGTILRLQDHLDEAAASFQKALAIKPAYIEAYNNLGAILNEQEKSEEAEICFRNAIGHNPNFAEAYNNLGIALTHQEKSDEAVTCYQRALAIKPDYAEAYSNLGNTLRELGKLDEAIACCQKALALKPGYAEAYNNLGNALKDQEKLDEAAICYRKAIEFSPDYAEAHNNLGATLNDQEKPEEAVGYYQKAIALNPNFNEAHGNLGNAFCATGKMNEAIACYRTSIKIKPGKAHSNLIFALDMAAGFDTPTLQQERKNWGEIHAVPLTAKQFPHANTPAPDRRLRIGYVSADFRRHSATTAFGAMLVKFDRDLFEVFAYSNSPKEDDYTQLFQQNVTAWRKIVGLSDDAVAEMVREDGIDILVDLSGHTAGNRLLVFARKPAPVQVTAWGCPSGTGMPAMDALFADPVVIPPEEKQFYTEQVRYLPNLVGFFSPETFPAVGALPTLSAKTITFGSFNRLNKISKESFDLWTRVLAAIPDSRLILKSREFDNPVTKERISRHFVDAGIASERVVILGKTPWHEHMNAFNLVDITLDPFPQGGGVTALEGLIMGVPIVALRWPTFGGRASASILTTLGLTDWIAETQEQYLGIAIQKAQDLEALANLRQDLRNRFTASPIGNAALYVKAVESAYRQLWQEWCKRHSNSSSMTAIP